jgi:hypothetical protein
LFKQKKWLLLLVIAFPSVFWLLLESSTINARKLFVYGPRAVNAHGDSVYHSVSTIFFEGDRTVSINPESTPIAVVVFCSDKYKSEGYRLGGLTEFATYKPDKLEGIPFVCVSEMGSDAPKKLFKGSDTRFLQWPAKSYDSLQKSYFASKPYYIDYSFLVLIDAQRHVRGYYDARYSAEVKRLIEEYRHLQLKEEKNRMIKDNEIHQEN